MSTAQTLVVAVFDRKGLEPAASRWVLTQAVRRRGFNPKKVE